MMMKDCQRWERCNAPICPLDQDWQKRRILDDDPVCFYLQESVKADAEATFRGAGRGSLFDLISTLTPEMSSRQGRIRRALERAKSTGSRMTTIPPHRTAQQNNNVQAATDKTEVK